MAPLSCASVSDLYGNNFGLSPEQLAEQIVKKTYNQQDLKENQIAGKANFQEHFPQSTFGNLNGNNTNIPPMVNQKNNLRNTNLPPNPAPISDNKTEFARRPAFTDINNNFPSNQGFSMFNRFQNLFGTRDNLFGTRENFGTPITESDCLHQLVSIANDIQLILRIIMFIMILLFIIQILKKN